MSNQVILIRLGSERDTTACKYREDDMQYLLLIYDEESRRPEMTPAEAEVSWKPWADYSDWLREAGWFVGGEALQRTATATTLRQVDGKTVTTDGPFAETKEQLGGFYLIDCPNLDDAIEATKRMPALERGFSVEIRPIYRPEG